MQLVPQFQDLKVGDVIPIGRGSGFPVTSLVRNRSMVLSGSEGATSWSWQMALRPIGSTHTRFITRNRIRFPQTVKARMFMCCLDLAAGIMMRKWLLNIKQRAEKLAPIHGRPITHEFSEKARNR
jgi:hypothetical protein